MLSNQLIDRGFSKCVLSSKALLWVLHLTSDLRHGDVQYNDLTAHYLQRVTAWKQCFPKGALSHSSTQKEEHVARDGRLNYMTCWSARSKMVKFPSLGLQKSNHRQEWSSKRVGSNRHPKSGQEQGKIGVCQLKGTRTASRSNSAQPSRSLECTESPPWAKTILRDCVAGQH